MSDERDATPFVPAIDRMFSPKRRLSLVDCPHVPSIFAADCPQCNREHDKLFEDIRKRNKGESKSAP